MANAIQNVRAVKLAYVSSDYPSTHYTLDNNTWYYISSDTVHDRQMLVKFEDFPAAIRHNRLIGVRLRLQIKAKRTTSLFGIYEGLSDFNQNTVTYYSRPMSSNSIFGRSFVEDVEGDAYIPAELTGTIYEAEDAGILLNSKSCIFKTNQFGYNLKPVLSNEDSIYAEVVYDDSQKITSKITYQSGPISGYYNPRNSADFKWTYVKSGLWCADETWDQVSATFYWKSSADESYYSISIGADTEITIPANTFPTAETISWYVEGTDDEGTTTQTPVYSFSTAAGTASAIPVSPINTVEDGSNNIVFKWDLSSTDGQPASRVYAAWKIYENTSDPWTRLFDVSNSITQYSVPANTFPAGGIVWTICAFNVDGVQGTFREARFISVAAPNPVGGLNATNVPYSTVTWQSGEQQAYQISVDGTVVKKAFGADVYSYTLTEPLDDGTHEISVIVQGIYGYWSQPSTVTVSIQNAPGDAVVLQGETGIDAVLSWDTSSTVSDFYVYRDGVNIGHTNSTAFYDKMSLGSHLYFVRNKLTDGNYTQSNTVVVTSEARGTFISLLNDNNWFEITRSENSASEQSYNYNRQYSLNHYSGAVYPVLELSPFENVYGSYNFACKDYATAKAFETFRGKEVIIKSRGDVVMVGAMVSLSSHYGDFINGYTFSIQRIHVEDYIDDTNA